MTADTIVDRVRSLVAVAPFTLTEAMQWSSFDLQPTTNVAGVFRIPPPASQRNIGRFGFVEDRIDSLQIWIARKHNSDYVGVRRQLLKDVDSVTAAVIRDAHTVSGDYNIPDEGRGHAFTPDDASKEYVALRLTLPIQYELQL